MNYNIGLRSFATSKSHPVDCLTSLTSTPSAISVKTSPQSLSTVKTPSSVIIRSTHAFPVKGREQFSKILCFPPCKGKKDKNQIRLGSRQTELTFAVCSIVTTTLVPALDTRSMAPPIPFTIFP